MALGADLANSARGFMFSLGCIQALKCNTNKCPTGIATSDPLLMSGLEPAVKHIRVANYQRKTLDAASSILGAMGLDDFNNLPRNAFMRRGDARKVWTFEELYPEA